MSMIGKARPRNRRGAIVAMGLGLLLTVVESIALVIDQTAVHGIARHLSALYAPYGLHPDPNLLFYYLYASAAIGILLWLTTIWAVGRRKRGTRVVATTVFVLATGIALLNLTVSEYGTRIFPLFWGILGLLPCVAAANVALPPLPVILAASAVVGVAFGPLGALVGVIVGERTPPELRGRVFGLAAAAVQLATPVGSLLVGYLLGVASVRAAIAALAAGCAVVALAGLFDPALGKMERPSEEPVQADAAGS